MPRRHLFTFALLLALAITTATPGHAQAQSNKPVPHAAKPAGPADPPLVDLAGYQQLVAKYHGKPLVVNFWATWCEPCRDEYPLIVELAKEFKAQGITVLGIDMDDDSDMNLVRRFIAKNQPPFPNYRQKPGINLDAFYDGVNPQWKGTMPQTIFYGRDGNIVGFFLGTRPRATFEDAFRATLATTANATSGARSSGH
jgi:cytochrome c biogenesis protein CcmG, thiol:disulfide interchange protein DsbE